jgi:hypothetical protein
LRLWRDCIGTWESQVRRNSESNTGTNIALAFRNDEGNESYGLKRTARS